MRETTLKKIELDTRDLPERWTEVLHEALLRGGFNTEARRLLDSALEAHRNPPETMETAESILAGDAFIPMAVEVLANTGVPLEEIDSILAEATSRFRH